MGLSTLPISFYQLRQDETIKEISERFGVPEKNVEYDNPEKAPQKGDIVVVKHF